MSDCKHEWKLMTFDWYCNKCNQSVLPARPEDYDALKAQLQEAKELLHAQSGWSAERIEDILGRVR